MKITMAHGSGGRQTAQLIDEIFKKANSNPVLDMMEDSAVVAGDTKIAITTDSFVVTPLIFKGGDIGSLAVCGTVNDLLMRGAVPKYITSAYIIEEGADAELLTKIAASMAETAKEAGVTVVAGDTKVIEGNGGIYINTTGVGFVNENTDIKSANCKNGDVIILSGTLGEHHAAILSERMGVKNNIQSDCAPLGEMVQNMMNTGIEIHAMRDITRGGLGTVLNEFANVSNCGFEIAEEKIPVTPEVEGFCKILGLDPLHMGNEGKMIAVVAEKDAEKAVQIIRKSKYGENAAIIGTVTDGEGVTMLTRLGGRRTVTELYGEGLPRIC
ncbi:MAG: hydrogenase expression/formation protein HypE [Clostridia bacterium]|nr:hydrogenase expression/formation protein HypE [Clostridia bacterium]